MSEILNQQKPTYCCSVDMEVIKNNISTTVHKNVTQNTSTLLNVNAFKWYHAHIGYKYMIM